MHALKYSSSKRNVEYFKYTYYIPKMWGQKGAKDTVFESKDRRHHMIVSRNDG